MKEYEVTKLGEGICLIFEPAEDVCMYVIKGHRKAALIDSGMGTGDLPALVAGLTDLPVLPLLTHGHSDHDLGMLRYPGIYMDPADIPLLKQDYETEKTEAQQEGTELPPLPEILPLADLADEQGRIDLGDRHLRIVPLAGHTPGSVGFLLEEDRILFSGDGLTYNVWMQLPESSTLEAYLQTLDAFRNEVPHFDRIYTGHSRTPFDAGFLERVIHPITAAS